MEKQVPEPPYWALSKKKPHVNWVFRDLINQNLPSIHTLGSPYLLLVVCTPQHEYYQLIQAPIQMVSFAICLCSFLLALYEVKLKRVSSPWWEWSN